MSMSERILFLALGCFLGFVLGYIVRALRGIEYKLDRVERLETMRELRELKERAIRNDDGIVTNRVLWNSALLIVVIMSVWASITSQIASNHVRDNSNAVKKAADQVKVVQKQQSLVTSCNAEFLSKTLDALNERTTYTRQQADNNVDLVQKQAEFFGIFLRKVQPPQSEVLKLFRAYVDALNQFVDTSHKAKQKALEHPFPTVEQLENCLAGKK
jgi:hypothetical protein